MDQGARRKIGWLQGSAMTIGAVLGSGVLVLPSLAADMAGPASLVSWLFMGMLTIPLVIVLAQLAIRCPSAGGIAAYARQAFGEGAGRITGFLFLGTVPFGAPICALIGAYYLGRFFSLDIIGVTFIAAGMLLVALLANYRGIRFSGNLQALVVGGIAVALLASIMAAWPAVRAETFEPFAPKGWPAVGTVMTVLFWAYVGWEMICHLTEEFEHPSRDIRRSLGVSLVIVNLLYLGLAYVTVGTGVYLGQDKLTALTGLLEGGWGTLAGSIVALLGVAACYATIHTYVAGFSRLVYSEAQAGNFPGWFTSLHPRFGTPHRVLLVLGPFTLLLLVAGLITQVDMGILIQFPGSIFIMLYLIAMGAGIRLLPKGSLGYYCAWTAFVVCAVIYLFNGWVGFYPPLLAGVCWLFKRKQPSAWKKAVEG